MKPFFALLLSLLLAAPPLPAQTPNNARMLSGVNLQAGTTYPFSVLDSTRLTVFTNASAVAATLSSGATFGFTAGTEFDTLNLGAGTVTITCTACLFFSGSSTGSATIQMTTGQGLLMFSAGGNYYAIATGVGSGSSFNPAIPGTIGGTTPAPAFFSCLTVPTGFIDAECSGTGSDGAAKISSIINNSSMCPSTGACVIDARSMSGSDLIWHSNPTHGPNRSVTILLGSHTYVACVPIVDGQTGYIWLGIDAPANPTTSNGSAIQAGTSAQCGGLAFPGNQSTITTTFQHGPFPAGTYASLYTNCGDPTTDSPVGTHTPDCFGGQLINVNLDCQNISTCSFNYFSAATEERSGFTNISMTGANNSCGFWDRLFQAGGGSPNGSGPVHFAGNKFTCTIPSSNTQTNFAIVWEFNTSFISFSGQSGCSATSNPALSGTPTAYTTISTATGVPGAPILTNGGNCSTPPTSCTLNSAAGGTGNVCSITTVGSAVTAISFSTAGTGYSKAAMPGGGPRFSDATFSGSSPSNEFNDAIWGEGDYNADIYDIHTQDVHGAVYHHGSGSAPYGSGRAANLDATNGGDAGSSVLHCGVGSLDNQCHGEAIQRIYSSGAVIIDDPNNTTLSTPTYSFVPSYPLPAGSGTVTSVGLTQTGSVFTITGSPVTVSGNLNLAFASQAQNFFLASPNGSTGAMAPRAIVAADIPTLNQNTTGTSSNVSGTPTLPNGTKASTQSLGDSSNDVATDAFVLANAGSGIVYNTPSGSRTSALSATTMATAGASGDVYQFTAYVTITTGGSGCSANPTSFALSLIFTDPNGSGTTTLNITNGTLQLVVTGNGAPGYPSFGPNNMFVYTFAAKAGTTVQYSTSYAAASGCSPGPAYEAFPALTVLQ